MSVLLSVSLQPFNCDSKYFEESAFEFFDVAEDDILAILESECISCLGDISILSDSVYEIYLHLCSPDALTFVTLVLKSTWTFQQFFFGLEFRSNMTI